MPRLAASLAPASDEVLISARNLRKWFPIRGGVLSSHVGDVRAVDGVSFDIHRGETVGLVGESGCGKTTAGRMLLRLIEPSSGHAYFRPPPEVAQRLDDLYEQLRHAIPAGSSDEPSALKSNAAAAPILRELDQLAAKYSLYRMTGPRMRALRGKLQIVFQDPFSSLSPRMLIRDIISEPMAIHGMGTRRERYQRVAELLQAVGLNPEHLWRFPHEFSGGQRQRIGIARALALRPDFIVLDEPTSALDVSVQAQILNILLKLQREQNLSYLFISHHLSVVRAVSHRVVVMYLGKVVETAPTEELFERPLHPYTQALLAAIPIPDPTVKRERIILSGDVPSPAAPPSGCRFHTRCPMVMPVCSKVDPPLIRLKDRHEHLVACHLFPEGATPELGVMSASSAPIIEFAAAPGSRAVPTPLPPPASVAATSPAPTFIEAAARSPVPPPAEVPLASSAPLPSSPPAPTPPPPWSAATDRPSSTRQTDPPAPPAPSPSQRFTPTHHVPPPPPPARTAPPAAMPPPPAPPPLRSTPARAPPAAAARPPSSSAPPASVAWRTGPLSEGPFATEVTESRGSRTRPPPPPPPAPSN